MGLFDLFIKKNIQQNQEMIDKLNDESLMTSQIAAMYVKNENRIIKDTYLKRLSNLGISKTDAEKIFEFDCNVIRKYNKTYLLMPDFIKSWFFGLNQPFFMHYPKTQEDVLKEEFLTISELCKIVDEAEWHFWNSHEKNLSEEVWEEIFAWHLKGQGGVFAEKYLDMIEEKTGVQAENLGKIVGEQGRLLSKFKW